MASNDKRSRSVNYTFRERMLLLKLVEQQKKILENKVTNAVSWKDKDMAWERVSKIFNATSADGIPRKKESLKKYYENLKKNVRKQAADQHRQLCKTGGGPPTQNQNDPTFDLTLSIINAKTVYGLNNGYDGDNQVSSMEYVEDNTENYVDTIQESSTTNSKSKGKQKLGLSSDNVLNNHQNQDEDNEDFYENRTTELGCTSNVDFEIITPAKQKECNETVLTSPSRRGTHENQPSCSSENNIEFVFSENHTEKEVPASEGNWKNVCPRMLQEQKTPSLVVHNRWANRRRPQLKSQSTSNLAAEYSEIAKLKLEFFESEKENHKIDRKQKDELFELQKKNLLLDIELKQLQIKQLKTRNVMEI